MYELLLDQIELPRNHIMRSIGKIIFTAFLTVIFFGFIFIYEAQAGYNVSDGSWTTGLFSTSTGNIEISGIVITGLCKTQDLDTGNTWIDIWDDDAGSYIASSTMIPIEYIEYSSDPENCSENETFSFPFNTSLTDGTEYEFQIKRSANSISYAYGPGQPYQNYYLPSLNINTGNQWGSLGVPNMEYTGQAQLLYWADNSTSTNEFWFDEFSQYSWEWHDLNWLKNWTCIIGESCYQWFWWTSDLDWLTLYLYDENENNYGGKILEPYIYREDYFQIDTIWNPTTPQSRQFYWIIPESYWISEPFRIYWVENNVEIDSVCDNWDCDCSEISTSTFDVAGQIQCGFMRLGCWALCPGEQARQELIKAKARLDNVFPFSTYNQVKYVWNQISTTSNDKITLNFQDLFTVGGATSSALTDFNVDLVMASSTLMSDTMGNLWDNYFYRGMEIVLDLFLILYLTVRVISLARGVRVEETLNVSDLDETKMVRTYKGKRQRLVDQKKMSFRTRNRGRGTRLKF